MDLSSCQESTQCNSPSTCPSLSPPLLSSPLISFPPSISADSASPPPTETQMWMREKPISSSSGSSSGALGTARRLVGCVISVAEPSRMRAVQHGGHERNGPPDTINVQPGPTQFVGGSLFAAICLFFLLRGAAIASFVRDAVLHAQCSGGKARPAHTANLRSNLQRKCGDCPFRPLQHFARQQRCFRDGKRV